jgi:hypothetical protein
MEKRIIGRKIKDVNKADLHLGHISFFVVMKK